MHPNTLPSQSLNLSQCFVLQIADIIARFERKGYKLVAIKILVPTKEFAGKHYAEHEGRPFFEGLTDFLSSGPVLAMVRSANFDSCLLPL